MIGLEPITILILLILSAFFSLYESSFLSISDVKVNSFFEEKKKGAKALLELKHTPRKIIITALVGNTLVNITAVSLATIYLLNFFPTHGILISTAIMSILILLFGQIIPKLIGSEYPDTITLLFSGPMIFFVKILHPITIIFEKISKKRNNQKTITDHELLTMIQMSKKEGVLNEKSADIIHNVLEFDKNIKISKIMTPKSRLILIDSNDKIKNVLALALKKDYTRFPVVEGKDENLIGIVSLTKLIKSKPAQTIKKISETPYIVPESKNTLDLLYELIENDIHIAAIVNEYGTFTGIITIEDIVKKIINLKDTGDANKKSKNEYVFDGEEKTENISKILELTLPKTESNTIAGYIEENLKRIPEKGEKLEINNLSIEILNATSKKISKVKIKKNKH